jgi:hydrogenase nickel incorporation protein HypA/HybF
MHELGITQEIVALVSERVQGRQVRRIVLRIGKLSAVLPDAVRFCFEVCAENTVLEGAELAILETPGTARCRTCGAEVTLLQPFGRCACGNSDLEWLTGEELMIQEVELV